MYGCSLNISLTDSDYDYQNTCDEDPNCPFPAV